MRITLTFLFLCIQVVYAQTLTDKTEKFIKRVEQLSLVNQQFQGIDEANQLLENPKNGSDDYTYLYAYLGGIYISMDSIQQARQVIGQSMEYAQQSDSPATKAFALRFKALLNSYFNLPDEVVKDAIQGLKLVEGLKDQAYIKYHLNYLLYATYSGWKEEQKMMDYILIAKKYAEELNKPNFLANVANGLSSIYLFRYRESQKKQDLDSNLYYMHQAYQLYQQHPKEVSGNTLVVIAVNYANYYLEHDKSPLSERKKQAYAYLSIAEDVLNKKQAQFKRWVNIYGIKSEFAQQEGDLELAASYLQEALSRIRTQCDNSLLRLEYTLYKSLASLSKKNNDIPAALAYQEKAEELLNKNFDQIQLFNAQKLEMQYESEKKDSQLKLLTESAALRQKMNYLYGGVALLAILGLAFMFRAYHYKLRYSIQREKQLAKEKEDAEQTAAMQVLFEKEEQARLKAEQDLLELKHQQLQKEALANSLLIDHKNDMLKQIKHKIQAGDAQDINKLLKDEALLTADFEDIKWQIQQLHPTFFQQLMERATQKLTALDLRYCAYLYLQMSTKQIAQVLHVEAQSVRMFKYRLKQKFGLPKESDLEEFLQSVDPKPNV